MKHEQACQTFINAHRHLAAMIFKKAEYYDQKVAMRFKLQGQWHPITWKELARQIRDTAQGLAALGVAHTDHVGIFAHNCPEWSISDLAIQSLRAVSVPIYGTNSAEEALHIIAHAKLKIIFVGDQKQFDAIYSLLEKCPQLEKIVVIDPQVSLVGKEKSIGFAEFQRFGSAAKNQKIVDQALAAAQPEDLATIIYTSGTTALPKGVMLSQKNFLTMLYVTGVPLPLGENHVSLCVLPLSHVFERSWNYFVLSRGAESHYCSQPKEVLQYFQESRPHYMCTVPRIWEKIYAKIQEGVLKASPIKKGIFHWALDIGGKYHRRNIQGQGVPLGLQVAYTLAKTLVLKKIHDIVGGRCISFNCGGAPLAPHVSEFFFNAGVMVAQGYGMTELFPICVTHAKNIKHGTCGPTVPLVDLRLSEEGEIQVRGPNGMIGYYDHQKATEEAFTIDGWLKTGDVGHIDEDGYVVITDRMKEMIITSGGKNISPQAIEACLKEDPLIEQAIAIGNNRHFITALICPAAPALEAFAREQGISYESFESLLHHPKVRSHYSQIVESRCRSLGKVSQVKKFTLVPREFSQEKGEMTATAKLKRRVIEKNFAQEIDAMYS